MFQMAVPVLRVTSAVAAEEFYCKRLGFTVLAAWRPDKTRPDPCYMTLGRDGAQMHVHSFQSGGALGGSAVYLFVDDVDALYAELMANGVSISTSPIDQTWGTREIGTRDPDQNIVTFGQRLKRP